MNQRRANPFRSTLSGGTTADDTAFFDLRQELNDEARAIIDQGNSGLLFGGSTEAEAKVFGEAINDSTAPRIGAFLGGAALANLKTQGVRQQRFDRIRQLQGDLLREQESRLGNATSRQNTLARTASAESIASAGNTSAEKIAGEKVSAQKQIATDKNTSAEKINKAGNLTSTNNTNARVAGSKAIAKAGNTSAEGIAKAKNQSDLIKSLLSGNNTASTGSAGFANPIQGSNPIVLNPTGVQANPLGLTPAQIQLRQQLGLPIQ